MENDLILCLLQVSRFGWMGCLRSPQMKLRSALLPRLKHQTSLWEGRRQNRLTSPKEYNMQSKPCHRAWVWELPLGLQTLLEELMQLRKSF